MISPISPTCLRKFSLAVSLRTRMPSKTVKSRDLGRKNSTHIVGHPTRCSRFYGWKSSIKSKMVEYEQTKNVRWFIPKEKLFGLDIFGVPIDEEDRPQPVNSPSFSVKSINGIGPELGYDLDNGMCTIYNTGVRSVVHRELKRARRGDRLKTEFGVFLSPLFLSKIIEKNRIRDTL